MTDCIIQRHQSLTELYSSLLIRKREIDRGEDKGTAWCGPCAKRKSEHLHDGRCSSSGPSEFRNSRHEEQKKVATAIDLIEQLMEIDN